VVLARREEQNVAVFWYIIIVLGILAAIINFSLAASRRSQPMVALVRALAGVVSLVPPIGVLVGKFVLDAHVPSQVSWQTILIATGVFVFAVLLLPTYVDKEKPKVSLQERAARPANATVRLEKTGGDEWVN
jgi:hypothetical protein